MIKKTVLYFLPLAFSLLSCSSNNVIERNIASSSESIDGFYARSKRPYLSVVSKKYISKNKWEISIGIKGEKVSDVKKVQAKTIENFKNSNNFPKVISFNSADDVVKIITDFEPFDEHVEAFKAYNMAIVYKDDSIELLDYDREFNTEFSKSEKTLGSEKFDLKFLAKEIKARDKSDYYSRTTTSLKYNLKYNVSSVDLDGVKGVKVRELSEDGRRSTDFDFMSDDPYELTNFIQSQNTVFYASRQKDMKYITINPLCLISNCKSIQYESKEYERGVFFSHKKIIYLIKKEGVEDILQKLEIEFPQKELDKLKDSEI